MLRLVVLSALVAVSVARPGFLNGGAGHGVGIAATPVAISTGISQQARINIRTPVAVTAAPIAVAAPFAVASPAVAVGAYGGVNSGNYGGGYGGYGAAGIGLGAGGYGGYGY